MTEWTIDQVVTTLDEGLAPEADLPLIDHHADPYRELVARQIIDDEQLDIVEWFDDFIE